ncbi:hypothetical protein [Cohnella luojiensis]|uniref:DUF2140 family protein n=1 Tax=Cohnella luojiensis TaxID=652876 RepID=A0A4Y8LQQ7_9BACL|nr:hypothetical protein [Cohnella luojiensis]TFE23664.1 hypothetical protein E2980_18485 [Cohnella luojiensis]
MKKLFIGLFLFAFLIVIAGVGALYYVKPDQQLDLAYEQVPLEQRAISMVRRLSPEMILTSEDLNNLAKKSIAENPQVEKDVIVTGANFTLDGELLQADLNIIWKNRISAGLAITYRLRWDNPNVVATVEKAKMKGITLPDSMFSDRVIPIGEELPKLLKIDDLIWGDGEVKVKFKKPTLEDLQQMIG